MATILLSGCGVGALLVGGGVAAGVLLSDDNGSSTTSPASASPFFSPPPTREAIRAHHDGNIVPICYQAGGTAPEDLAIEYSREAEDFDLWRSATPAMNQPSGEACSGASTFWWAAAADLGLGDRTAERVRARVHSRKQRNNAAVSSTFTVGNTPAVVQFIPISVTEAGGDITLSFDARDAEGDPLLDVKLFFQEPTSSGEAGAEEVEITLKRPRPEEPALPRKLPAPDNGFIYSPQWDSRRAMGNRNVLQLRIGLQAQDDFGLQVRSELPPFNLRNNRPAEARLSGISEADDTSFNVPVHFRLLDPDQHRVDVVVQYVVDGGSPTDPASFFTALSPDFLDPDYRARVLVGPDGAEERARLRIATPASGTMPLELVATASGVEHRFVWDTLRDLKAPASTSVRVRITPYDAEAGKDSETVNPFVVRNDLFPVEILLGEGEGPVSGTALGDLDGDGRPDVALAFFAAPLRPQDSECTTDRGRIDVFLRASDGYFLESPLRLRPGSAASLSPCEQRDRGPSDLVIADLDGDGANDLVALSTGCALDDCRDVRGEVSIFHGPFRRGGTLIAPDRTLVAGADVRSMALGNLDAGGRLDIAVSNHRRFDGPPSIPRSVGIFRQVELHSFGPMEIFSDCDRPECEPGLLVCADFDGDKLDEIAVRQDEPTKNQVLVLKWSSVASELVTLTRVQLPRDDRERADFSPIAVAAADLDFDDSPELLVGSRKLSAVYAFSIDPDGAFGVPRKICLNAPPERITLADITGDGSLELIAVEPGRLRGAIEIVEVQSQACCPAPCLFKEILFPLPAAGHAGPATPAIGDLSGDGYPDLLFSASDGARLLVSARPGSLLGSRSQTLSVGSSSLVRALALGDLNGDGLTDLAAAASVNRSHYEVLLYFQRQRDGFPDRPSRILRSNPGGECSFQDSLYLELADANEDGIVDLIALGRWGGLDVFGRGKLGFSSELSASLETCDENLPAANVIFGHFGGSGIIDILRLDKVGDPLTRQGRLLFTTVDISGGYDDMASIQLTAGPAAMLEVQPQTMAKADFNADGEEDVALLYGQSSALSILYQSPSGSWPNRLEPGARSPAAARNGSLIPADFDSDGRTDMLLIPFEGEDMIGYTWSAVAQGAEWRLLETFRLRVGESGAVPLSAAAADWSGDGRIDIVAGVAGQRRLLLYHQNESDSFEPLSAWSVELKRPLEQQSRIVGRDWSGDGSIDLVISYPDSQEICILEAR